MKLIKKRLLTILVVVSLVPLAFSATTFNSTAFSGENSVEISKAESDKKIEKKKKRSTVNKLKVYKVGETVTINGKKYNIEGIKKINDTKFELFTSEQLTYTQISLVDAKGKELQSTDTWGEGISSIVETQENGAKYIKIKGENKKALLIKIK